MKKSNVPPEREIVPRLRNSQIVRDALRRLTGQGKREVESAEMLAVNGEATLDQRLDAITIVTALKRGSADVLLSLLSSDDQTIVIEALKSIRNFRTEWARPILVNAVRSCKEPSKRAVFAWALAAYRKDDDVERALLEVAVRDDDSEVRNHAIESLGEFRSDGVLEALLKILESGPPAERFWALYSLGTLADARAVDMVKRSVQDQTPVPGFGTIADEARWALEQMRNPKSGR